MLSVFNSLKVFSLTEQRNQLIARMEDMQKTLERLNYKIERYEQAIIPIENELKKSED